MSDYKDKALEKRTKRAWYMKHCRNKEWMEKRKVAAREYQQRLRREAEWVKNGKPA